MNKVVEEFAALVAPEIPDEKIDLLRAALTFALPEYPGLDASKYIGIVEGLAERVLVRRGASEDPAHTIASLNVVLFQEEGLAGNQSEFYDPRNSYLNEVLERRLGIPISLSVIYMEVAQRVGLPVFGVGLPGHFLLKHYDSNGNLTFIDPYVAGGLLSPSECQTRLDEVYGGQMTLQPEFLNTVSKRQILTRMLNNLRSIYVGQRNFKKALTIVDFILAIHPRSPDDLRQRALLRYNQGMLRAAIDDLEEYLRLAPDASDAEEMKQTVLSIRRSMAMMN
jgi:regulator of sirC expression with transglutaminase-like and TPR domain